MAYLNLKDYDNAIYFLDQFEGDDILLSALSKGSIGDAFVEIGQLEDAYDYCEQITRNEARNFYYAFITLPMRKKRAIYTAYAFCRRCDDAVDNSESTTEKKRLLDEIENNLKSGINLDKLILENNPIILATCAIIKEFNIPQQYFFDVIQGVRMDIEFTTFNSFFYIYSIN